MLTALRSKLRKALAGFGRGLGSFVIHFWPRIRREEYAVPVHILVSLSSWHCGLLAAISLETLCEKNWRFVFHEDGSVTEAQRKQILKTLPGVRFVSRAEADEKVGRYLMDFPRCREHRDGHNFFLKLFDPCPFSDSLKYIVMDSDVLFFKRPAETIDWATGCSDAVFYNEDTQEKYCNPRKELEVAFGIKLWPKFNGGFVLMQSKAMNLPLGETLFEKFQTKAHHPQFFEQTLYCLMASAWGCGGALPRTYEINWEYLRSRGAVCRHYVGAFKHDLLYIEGATVLFLRLLPAIIKGTLEALLSKRRIAVAVIAALALIASLGVMASGVSDWVPSIGLFRNIPFEAVQKRSGLPNTLAKLDSGSPLLVGFLGGSITQNAEPHGFVSALKDHLVGRFPESRIRTLNAGMASTDSAWGAKRIDWDLLAEKPDLIFVEFAVNDGDRDSARDMERIVRKIHEANSEAEVVFIYTTSDSAFRKLSKGKLPPAIDNHEKVASHYGIPSVIFGSDLFEKIRSGEWVWTDFSEDVCHPTRKGYKSYNRDFVAALDELLRAEKSKQVEFPAPMVSDFELRPPVRVAAPIAETKMVADSAGQKSRSAERMPLLSSEWIGDSRIKAPSGSEWRLESAVFEAVPDEVAVGSTNAKWSPARWFEEGGGFTGERSRLLAESGCSQAGKLWMAPYIGGGSVEVPRVVWIPLQSGECDLEIRVAKITGHVNGPPASAGLQVALRKQDGEILKIGSVQGGEGSSLHFRKALRINPGDSVMVRPFAKGYEFLQFDGVEMTTAFFDTAPTF